MDKQQGPTVEHREVYSTSCNKSWWKGTWRYIKLNHFAVCRKLTQYCEATILQFLKNEIMRLVSLSKKEETPEISFSVHKHKKKPCKDTERRQLPKSQEERLHQKPNLPTPWSWRFSLQNCEKINVCCVSHSVCGILLWQRELRHFVVLHVQSLSYVQLFVTPWTVVHRLLCPRDFPGKNSVVGCHFLLQGIFPTQGLNPHSLHWQVDSLPLSHQGQDTSLPGLNSMTNQNQPLQTPLTPLVRSQFVSFSSCCSDAQWSPTLCNPMDCSTPGLPVPHHLPEFAQVHVHCISDAIQPFHPLMPSSPSALNLSQHQGLFQWVSVCIRWSKYWSFSFSISPSREYSGLITLKIDWFDLLAVQGTLRSLLQHHNSKASILQHSTFFMVQLSQPHVATGKSIGLTIQTFVGRVMSLPTVLSRFVIAFLPRSNCLLISWLQSPSSVNLEPNKRKYVTASIFSPLFAVQ